MNEIKQIIKSVYFILIMFMSLFIICESGIVDSKTIGMLLDETINEKDVLSCLYSDILYTFEDNKILDYEYFDLSYDDFSSKDNVVSQDNEEKNNEENNNEVSNNNENEINEEPTTDVKEIPTFASLTENYSPKIIYSNEQLSSFDFLVENCYIIDSTASVKKEELDAKTLLSIDSTLKKVDDGYKVLIYHTHGSETFVDSREGVIEDTVVGLGDELEIYLESYGISVYHDRTIYDYQNGVLDRSKAYDLARENVDKILAENPSIEVVIDLHRDGVREDVHLVTEVDGVKTAKLMFVNGVSRSSEKGDLDYLYNPNKISNLSFSLKMHLKGKELFGDLMRKIYVRAYCFNLDCVPNAALVEVGAQTNTVEEAKNAMKPLSLIIYSVLTEK